MKTIFCPVDFSHTSQMALEWAAMLSVKRNWKLILFNKYMMFPKNENSSITDSKDPLGLAKKEVEEKLTDLKNQLCVKYQGQNIKCEIDSGFGIDVEDVILNYAEKSKADLIVMGTKGAESFDDILGGSITTNVISQTSIPVLVVPDSAGAYLPDTIVYSSDLKNEDQDNLSFVLELAHDLEAKINFVHIQKEGEPGKLAELKGIISEILASLPVKGQSIEIYYEELKGNDFYSVLEEYMSSKRGMVVLGKHNRNFFERLIHGDFIRLMSLYTFHPLLVLHKKN